MHPQPHISSCFFHSRSHCSTQYIRQIGLHWLSCSFSPQVLHSHISAYHLPHWNPNSTICISRMQEYNYDSLHPQQCICFDWRSRTCEIHMSRTLSYCHLISRNSNQSRYEPMWTHPLSDSGIVRHWLPSNNTLCPHPTGSYLNTADKPPWWYSSECTHSRCSCICHPSHSMYSPNCT